MRTCVAAAIVAASVLTGSAAWAACLPSRSNSCVDFGVVPQISQEIVAGEPTAPPPKAPPAAEPPPPYTGPTLGPTTGAGPAIRRAPTVGYHWSLD